MGSNVDGGAGGSRLACARWQTAADGVQVKVWPWVATAAVLLGLSATVSRWATTYHHTTVEEIGPAIVFAAGIAAFGLWAGAAPVAVAGAAMVAASVAAPAIAAGDTSVALQLVVDAALLVLAARCVTQPARR